MKDFLGLEVNTQCHLFDSMIKPILSYGCEVWGTREYDVLEKVLLHFCRAILGVGPKCTKAAMLGELGRLPLYIWHQQRTARYLTRIMRGTNSSLLNDAMQLSICMAKDGFHSWVWHVVTFVNNLDIPAELESLPQCLKEISNDEIQERLKNEYINKWRTVLWDHTPRGSGGGNKLRTYRTIKAQYEIEHYLYTIKIREHRVAMARLRLSCHPLRIETSRYNRPYLSAPHRYCYFCMHNCHYSVVEDELHFMCFCPLYDSLRVFLYYRIKCKYPLFNLLTPHSKFSFLLCNTDPYVNRCVGAFIYSAFAAKRVTM